MNVRAIKTGFDPLTSRYNFQLHDLIRNTRVFEARQLFDQMAHKNTFSVNIMISGYIKSGNIACAKELFDSMVERTEVSWRILMGGYVRNKQPVEAFSLFADMCRTGMKPEHVTFATLLSGFDETMTRNDVCQVHARIARLGFDSDLAVCNSLVDSYCKSGNLGLAFRFFKDMVVRDTATFNSMVTGFAREGLVKQAVVLLSEMQHCGFKPSDFTFAALLRGSVGLNNVTLGEQFQGLAIKTSFVHDVYIGNAILDLYAKHNHTDDVRKFFVDMPELDVVSYNIMITNYARNGQLEESLNLFREIWLSNFSRRKFPFATLLSIAATKQKLDLGRKIHAQALVSIADKETHVVNALVDMYAKCGRFNEAKILFYKLAESDKSSVPWTTLISGYVQQGFNEEALLLYKEMRRKNVYADQATFALTAKASANLAQLSLGKQLHSSIMRAGFMSNVYCGCAILDMYAKCGSLKDAIVIFNEMPERNAISWNAVMSAYAQNGDGKATLRSFEDMIGSGIQPDPVSFLCVLTACRNCGLVEEALQYFKAMTQTFKVVPWGDHYASMVDVLCGTGRFQEAESLMAQMPFEPDESMWSSILNACRIHKNQELAKKAADELFNMNTFRDAASYVTMSNSYAEAGDWKQVSNIKKSMRDQGVRKIAGYSWVEIQHKIHTFTANDKTHPLYEEIRRKIDELATQLEEEGYKPVLSCVLQNVDDAIKAESLKYHSERLAIAFALISTPEGSPVVVMKNLRTCLDCHAAIKVISKVVQREITVRDSSRFHHFKDGACSCGDYW